MEMVKMIATSEHVYAGRQLKKGDDFYCEKVHVKVMEILGRARQKDEVPAVPAQEYRTREMTAKRRRVKA